MKIYIYKQKIPVFYVDFFFNCYTIFYNLFLSDFSQITAKFDCVCCNCIEFLTVCVCATVDFSIIDHELLHTESCVNELNERQQTLTHTRTHTLLATPIRG